MMRETNRAVLYGVVNQQDNLMAFGSGGRTTYLSEQAAEKALENAIQHNNDVCGCSYQLSDFRVIKLIVG